MSDTQNSLWSDSQPPRLLASRQPATGELRFPPHPAHSPLAHGQEIVALPAGGSVYSFTVIHANPKSGLPPFTLGYVDLPGPVRIMGRIVGEVAIGAACQPVPDARFGYVFRVTDTEGEQA